MSESCRFICRYYNANYESRKRENQIFKKYCHTCDLELISRYHRCPCCHSEFMEKNNGIML